MIRSQVLVELDYAGNVELGKIIEPFWAGIRVMRSDISKGGGIMDARKHFYGESFFERNKRSYGLHPKCKKCLTRKEGKCENPQYDAKNADFYCADYREE